MNHEGEASSSAAGAHYSHDGRQDKPEAAPTAAELAERRKKNRQMFNRKRGDLLDNVLRDLDMLVYAELGVIYYMEYDNTLITLRTCANNIPSAAHSYDSSSGFSYNFYTSPRNSLLFLTTRRIGR
jgi:hypothetical protein